MCARASERASERAHSVRFYFWCATFFLVRYWSRYFEPAKQICHFICLEWCCLSMRTHYFGLYTMVRLGFISIGYHLHFWPFFQVCVCVCVRRVFATGIRPGKMIFEYIFSAHTSLKEMCVHKVYTLWQFSMVTLIEFNIPHFKSWLNILSQTLPTPIKLKSVRF